LLQESVDSTGKRRGKDLNRL